MVPLFVLDASALLTLVLCEPQAPMIAELLRVFAAGKVRMLEPNLWQYEIANTLHQKASCFGDRPRMISTYQQLCAIDFVSRDPEPKEVEQAFGMLAAMKGQTYYDAIYHAMAVVQRGTLVTADRRYATAAERWGRMLLIDEMAPLLSRLKK